MFLTHDVLGSFLVLIKRKDTTAICSFVVKGLLVLAPLIGSGEGGDMNGLSGRSSVGLPKGLHVCVRQVRISPRNPRGCVICFHAEKTDLLPSSALHL